MATKKYVSLDGLTKYDELIKKEIAKKADSGHSHDSRYYTETEIDNKLSAVNTSIDNITSGEVVVEEAKHAQSATTSNSCTGNAATATTASKLGTKAVGSTTQPIYLDNGVATGVTKVDVSHGGTGATTAADAITNLGAVDMTSEQEITGIKNFYNGIKIGNANLNFDSSVGALVISFPEGGE